MFHRSMFTLIVIATFAFTSLAAAQTYEIDPAHTSIVFRCTHGGISHIYGFFTDVKGKVVSNATDVSKSSFEATINVDSINTGVKKRDDHLKTADFFSVAEFPDITFKSTKVEKAEPVELEKGKPALPTFRVTGDLTMHGVTKPVTLLVHKLGESEFPKGSSRVGYVTQLDVKRSEFGMVNMIGPVSDDIHLDISFEAVNIQ